MALICAFICFAGSATAFSANTDDCVYLTVIMYHSILNSRSGVYIVSEAQLDDDLTALEQAGYSFVFPSEVIAYAEGNGSLPEKPLIVTFDDGHYNNMYYGLPILVKHNAKACINVIGKFSEFSSTSGDDSNPNYSHLTWEQVGTLKKSGYFEIGSHTYNMHNYKPRYGVAEKYGESEAEYRQALKNDISAVNEKIYGAIGEYPVTFAYPFGKYNDVAKDELLNAGFKLMFTCNEGVTKIYKNKPESLHYVRRYNRSGLYSTYSFVKKLEGGLDKAVKK